MEESKPVAASLETKKAEEKKEEENIVIKFLIITTGAPKEGQLYAMLIIVGKLESKRVGKLKRARWSSLIEMIGDQAGVLASDVRLPVLTFVVSRRRTIGAGAFGYCG